MPIFVKNIGSRAVRVPRLCRWQPGAPTTRSSVSVGRCREDGRNFRGTIPVLCLRRPHAKSLALLPDSLHSPALVKLTEAATAVTIPARHMPIPFFGKPLTCRDLPAANGSASDSDSRGIAVRQCTQILSHSGAKQTSNRDRPFENTVRPHFSDRKQISPPRPKPSTPVIKYSDFLRRINCHPARRWNELYPDGTAIDNNVAGGNLAK